MSQPTPQSSDQFTVSRSDQIRQLRASIKECKQRIKAAHKRGNPRDYQAYSLQLISLEHEIERLRRKGKTR